MTSPTEYDAIVLGAGAAGLFCTGEAARRGVRVLALDHAKVLGEKIRISGGGRCNFTNLGARPEHFLSENPKFAISALSRFTPKDFLARVEAAGIGYHQKALGQLFCDGRAQEITDMLFTACREGDVTIEHGCEITSVGREGRVFVVECEGRRFRAPMLVVATGGKSIPKIGATGFGYQIAQSFGLDIIEPRPALVPLTFEGAVKEMAASLAGVSVEANVTADPEIPAPRRRAKPTGFKDGFLFTHRGLSGPSILQISSFWREGGAVVVDLAPGRDVASALLERKRSQPRAEITTALADHIPKRLAQTLSKQEGWAGRLADWSDKRLHLVAEGLHAWRVTPSGSEGYRTAEVTLGGVSTAELDSRTMEAKRVPGLYFIGEVVDVTGWLGGYNFQWAWSSAYVAAQALAEQMIRPFEGQG
ncbi:MAG: NAD(P)/FAD-dependent oxidoreductase [Parvularcula sp.]|jgi:predicted Rossmann fold flavoprotein|nr:NAD(P)/FAD-dependent oxidoreductase [Parvularcula sp.]